MKISPFTISALKKFSEINKGITIGADECFIHTTNVERSVYGRVRTDEVFPVDICIYDLPRFLSTVSKMEDADFDFSEEYVKVKSGNRLVKFFYTPKDLIVSPRQEPPLSSPLLSFVLPGKYIEEIVKMSSILQTPDFRLACNEDGVLTLSAMDSKNETAPTYSAEIGLLHNRDVSHFSINLQRDVLSPIFFDYDYKANIYRINKTIVLSLNTEDDKVLFVVSSSPSSTYG